VSIVIVCDFSVIYKLRSDQRLKIYIQHTMHRELIGCSCFSLLLSYNSRTVVKIITK